MWMHTCEHPCPCVSHAPPPPSRACVRFLQDKINAFWEITKKDLEDRRADLRNKDREMEEMEERHMVEVKVGAQGGRVTSTHVCVQVCVRVCVCVCLCVRVCVCMHAIVVSVHMFVCTPRVRM